MAHMVCGVDGSAAVGGRVGALSTAPDRDLFLSMRALADVVLVGAETVRREGYGPVRLSAQQAQDRRSAGRVSTPALAIVSRSLSLDWAARAFTDPPAESQTVVVTCESADRASVDAAQQVAKVVFAGTDRVDPQLAVERLADLGFGVVLCEGGPGWLGELVAADLLDELCLTVAPMMGGDPLPVAVTPPGAPLVQFALRHALIEGDTLFLRYERGPR